MRHEVPRGAATLLPVPRQRARPAQRGGGEPSPRSLLSVPGALGPGTAHRGSHRPCGLDGLPLGGGRGAGPQRAPIEASSPVVDRGSRGALGGAVCDVRLPPPRSLRPDDRRRPALRRRAPRRVRGGEEPDPGTRTRYRGGAELLRRGVGFRRPSTRRPWGLRGGGPTRRSRRSAPVHFPRRGCGVRHVPDRRR